MVTTATSPDNACGRLEAHPRCKTPADFWVKQLGFNGNMRHSMNVAVVLLGLSALEYYIMYIYIYVYIICI